jgi:glycine cleavage system regulatory protein
MATSLVVTIIGPDRPGLVSLLSDRGKAHDASWAESRMASLAGQFAGMVRFEVAAAKADALAASLRDLEATGLRVTVARGDVAAAPAGARRVRLDLVGLDRPGIVRDISRVLAEAGISIDELETEIASGAMSGEAMFKASALLRLPPDAAIADLRRRLEALANELMVDIALDERAPGASV